MADVLSSFHLPAGSVALGSVKSNIGHLKGAAGAAGLLKATLALRDKVLPPSLHCEHPNPDIDFAHSPLYVNTELKPWTVPADAARRAGVSAFGFGGTNFHAVLEEYIPGRLNGNGKRSVAVTAPLASCRGEECQRGYRHAAVTCGSVLQSSVTWRAGDRRGLRRRARRASAGGPEGCRGGSRTSADRSGGIGPESA